MPPQNLALHKPYTMEPTPNYHYLEDPMCTDAGDKTDLTDGRRATFRGGYLWWCKEAIGLGVNPKDKIFRVVIDLGKSSPIGRVMVSTSPRCPEAGVSLNSFALALSEDGKAYQVMDRLTPLQPLGTDEEREKPRQGLEVNLNGYGVSARYVCVAVIPNSLVTMDEIEVYPAEGAPARQPILQCSYQVLPDRLFVPSQRSVLDEPLFAELYAEVLRETADPEQKYFLSLLSDLQAEYQRALGESAEACEKVMSQLPALAAEWNRSRLKTLPDLMAWPANPYETPAMFSVPAGQAHEQTLHLLRDQKGIAAINVCWKCSQPARLTAALDGPSGAELRRAYRADAVTAVGTARVADALVLEKDNPLTLTPGVVEQLLLFISPAQKRSAIYKVRLRTEGGATTTFAVRVERAPVALPSTFDTVDGGWFYLDWDTKLVPAEVQANYLRESHVNIAMFTGACVAVPVFNARGEVVTAAGESPLVQFVKQQSFCRYFYFFFRPDQLKWEGGKPPSDPTVVARAYAECVRQNIERLKPLGIRPDQILLGPADEDPRGEKWIPIRNALDRLPPPRPKLFCTMGLPGKDSPEIEAFIRAVDIFVMKGPWYQPGNDPANLLPRMRANGKQVWSYDCGSTTAASPNHYRLYPWQMLAAGSPGDLWWAHTSDQPQWATPGHGFGLYYGKRGAPAELKIEEDLVPSRRMEAWRQGIEDRWLMERVRALARKQHLRSSLAPVALAYVDEQLDKALAHPDDASIPQEASDWLVRMLGSMSR